MRWVWITGGEFSLGAQAATTVRAICISIASRPFCTRPVFGNRNLSSSPAASWRRQEPSAARNLITILRSRWKSSCKRNHSNHDHPQFVGPLQGASDLSNRRGGGIAGSDARIFPPPWMTSKCAAARRAVEAFSISTALGSESGSTGNSDSGTAACSLLAFVKRCPLRGRGWTLRRGSRLVFPAVYAHGAELRAGQNRAA
jgi:hypothetical protein